jgi:tetratricopeptide (TPR) repeat protein
VPAWEAKGYALSVLGRHTEALAALEECLTQAPQRETALHLAGQTALVLGQRQAAIAYWQRAIAINPWYSAYHAALAHGYAGNEEWAKARDASLQVLRLQPFHLDNRKLLVACYLQLGDREQARREFDLLLSLNPSDREQLQRWFATQLR